jgi:hypothetical protein
MFGTKFVLLQDRKDGSTRRIQGDTFAPRYVLAGGHLWIWHDRFFQSGHPGHCSGAKAAGQNAFEVAVVDSASQPSAGALKTAWKARRGVRVIPLPYQCTF